MSQDEVPQESEVPEEPQAPPDSPAASPSRLDTILHQPLTKIQALVGVFAGLITITGSVVSLAGLHDRPPALGEMIAVIQDMREHAPLADATVEILTPQDALVTTLTAPSDGRVARRLKEGKYRVRVSHPQFMPQVRQIEVSSGERSEMRVALAPRPAPPVVTTAMPPTLPPIAPAAPAAPAEKTPPANPKSTKPAKAVKPPRAHEKAQEPVKVKDPARTPAPPSVAQPPRRESP
jgi:hypothetical protein